MSKKTYERIKNYTTSIAIEKTIAEIEKMLATFGVMKIMKEYDSEGRPSRLSFTVLTNHGEMPVKLPVNVEGIKKVFKIQVSEKKLPSKFWNNEGFRKEQARRVGWRIIKDWLDVQLSLLSIGMVKIEEIFLSYIYDSKLEKTMFEMLEERNFNLMIENKSNSQNTEKIKHD